MGNKINTTLASDYERACRNYYIAFCKKHDFEPEPFPWVGNRVGGTAEIADFYVGIDDMRTDVDSLCGEDEFFKWYNYSVRAGSLGVTTPNFEYWLRKCPIRSEAELAEMEATRAKIEELKEMLRVMADEGCS